MPKRIITILLLLIPTSEFVLKSIQYLLGKIVKPKILPKMEFFNGIDSENATFVIIPTIIISKGNVQDLFSKLYILHY